MQYDTLYTMYRIALPFDGKKQPVSQWPRICCCCNISVGTRNLRKRPKSESGFWSE